MGSSCLKKLNEMECKEQHHVQVSNGLSDVEDLDSEVDSISNY
jgi:hypothetical protein